MTSVAQVPLAPCRHTDERGRPVSTGDSTRRRTLDLTLPEIVSRRRGGHVPLLAEEKAMTKARDALSTSGEAPMVDRQGYVRGTEAVAADLFDGRRQLSSSTSCSIRVGTTVARAARQRPTSFGWLLVTHSGHAFVVVSRRPQARALQAQAGLDVPVVLVVRQRFQLRLPRTPRPSCAGEFNFRATSSEAHGWGGSGGSRAARLQHLPRRRRPDLPHLLGYARARGGRVFLDLTALGRQEDWEEPKGRADVVRGASPDFST